MSHFIHILGSIWENADPGKQESLISSPSLTFRHPPSPVPRFCPALVQLTLTVLLGHRDPTLGRGLWNDHVIRRTQALTLSQVLKVCLLW